VNRRPVLIAIGREIGAKRRFRDSGSGRRGEKVMFLRFPSWEGSGVIILRFPSWEGLGVG